MGDSFQCAVALANIEVIERENLLEKSTRMGALLKGTRRTSNKIRSRW